ncbi:type I polyketide synthase [Streptomyces sp. NPDC048484]|uniref:type I polyketide synthase n=1 Tax=Streptomyces sp. NPDC048484 TaxID=3155146 RepID=UPI00342182EE
MRNSEVSAAVEDAAYDEPIAVVGMACRLPQAPDTRAFWRMLVDGRSGITEVPADRWDVDAYYDKDSRSPGRINTRHGGFLDGVGDFDAAFFSLSPREAAAADPQQRLTLELCWEALEDAGVLPRALVGEQVGVFVGAMAGDYALASQRGGAEAVDQYTFTGLNRALIANRVSYTFGLHGPSMTVDSGQSSSLVALHLACASLRSGESELALAGGVHLNLAPESAVSAAKLGVLSPDGQCYTFDERANGIVRGEGGGLVVLKPLARAVSDGDDIYCVVRGSAVNNDGSGQGLTAPNPSAQEAVLRTAHRRAGVVPADVQYVELHGTGTRLGDQVEAAALGTVFAASRDAESPLPVGSVKTNIGHLEGAAGIAGLLKTALSIHHGVLPAQLNFVRADDRVPLDRLGLSVQRENTPWPHTGSERLAGVSSFGVGGTNCHVVISSPPASGAGLAAEPDPSARRAAGVVPWPVSGRTAAALREQARRLHDWAEEKPELDPADVAFSLATTRTPMEHRAVTIASDREGLLAGLRAVAAGETVTGTVRGMATRPAKTVFVFPGQGSQWGRMAVELRRSSPVFRRRIEECADALAPLTGWSLTDVLEGSDGAPPMDRLDVVPCVLFAMMVSLAELWRSHGVEPDAIVGHSQGEVAAACVAGALTLPEAARIVAVRSRAVKRFAGSGGLVSVARSEEETLRLVEQWGGRLSIAVVNGSASTVVSGLNEVLDELLAMCREAGIRARRIPSTDYAGHSSQLDVLHDDVTSALAGLRPRGVPVPFYSTVTGGRIDTAGLDNAYWFHNMRDTVRFAKATRALLSDGYEVFLEISPHPVLVQGIEETAESSRGEETTAGQVSALGTLRRDEGGLDRFLTSLAEAYTRGVDVDWTAASEETGARRIKLPCYAFQRQRHWLDSAAGPSPADAADAGRRHVHPTTEAAVSWREEGGIRSESEALELLRRHAADLLGHPGPEAVDPAHRFRDLGFTSLTALDLRNRLQDATGLRLPSTLLYDHPTPQQAARFLLEQTHGPHAADAATMDGADMVAAAPPGPGEVEPLAIVSMACRFPGGADTPERLWHLVASGTDAISEFPGNRGWDLEGLYDPEPGRPGKTYVRSGGFLHDADRFDASLFGISPREALAMDPQQRLLLETAWETLERAGMDPMSLGGSRTGVFVGAMAGDYGPRLHEIPEEVQGHALTGLAASVLAGRLSYTFGFEGPAMTLDTACSSALVALHQAAQSVRCGESDMALAGGVTVMSQPGVFLEFSRQRAMSSDGRCKSFSADADGTGWSEGVGLLLVERLSDARRQGHPVLALLRGSATNQDGASNGLTAPNGPSQERVMRAAMADAGLEPHQIDMVEAHGTGTRLGDPIEIQALTDAYGRGRKQSHPLRIGSLKSNIGHTQAAAGAGGVIKMVLALRHGLMPRTLHALTPTPHADWSAGLVRPLIEEVPWPRGEQPRRAGVSSFGLSGTNAHVILEEAPDIPRPAQAGEGPADAEQAAGAVPVLCPVSGHSTEALRAQAAALREHFASRPGQPLSDVALSLATGRANLDHRAVVLAQDTAHFLIGLEALENGRQAPGLVRDSASTRGFGILFAGQGSQRPGMGQELYRAFPVFAEALDEVCGHLDPYLERPLQQVMFAPEGSTAAALLDRTRYTQPALFAFEVALYRLVERLIQTPAVLMGHSVGELAAAHVAGVLNLSDACTLVAARGRLMQALPSAGAMVSLQATQDEVRLLIEGGTGALDIAAVNGPNSVVISGDQEAAEELAERWRAAGRKASRLRVSHAFHSPHMDGMLAEFGDIARGLRYAAPQLPVISNVTGRPAAENEIRSPAYWVRHVREAVLFDSGVRRMAADGVGSFLELGPRGQLSAMGRLCLADRVASGEAHFVSAVRGDRPEAETMVEAMAELHCRGVALDWKALLGGHAGPRVALPTYAFQRERYWLAEAETRSADLSSAGLRSAGHPLLGAAVELPDTSGFVFSGRLSLGSHPWLADHSVLGTVLLPGALFAEWALHAARRLGTDQVAELTLETPLILPEQGAVDIRLTVDGPDAAGNRRVTVHSRAEDHLTAEWTRHAVAVLATDADHDLATPSPASPARTAGWPPPGAEPVDTNGLYDRLDGRGFHYGPAFRGLRAAWRGGDDVFADVEVDSGLTVPAGGFLLHPVLLDAALHAAFIPFLDAAGGTYLPFAWRGVRVHAPGARAARVHVTPNGTNAVTITVTDADGAPVASVESLAFRPVTAEQLGTGHAAQLLQLVWKAIPKPRAAPASSQQWAFVGTDHTGVTGALKSAGGQIATYQSLHSLDDGLRRGEPAPDAVLVSCTDETTDVRTAVQRALVLIQEWLADSRLAGCRLAFITRGAVSAEPGEDVPDLAGSAVWGLVRGAQSEHPGRFVLVDLDEVDGAGGALTAAVESGEPQLAVRRENLTIPRLKRCRPVGHEPADGPPVPARRWDPRRTVLVTGGTGALGALVARHLVGRHGVRRLLLLSRRGPGAPGADELAAELRELGAHADVVACDVADRADLERSLAAIPAEHPLGTVIHTAGVVDDQMVAALTPRKLDTVLRPKVDAALHLHELTRERPDCELILFSSAIGVLGGAGQANYAAANAFLDALSHRRRATGLPGISLAWGLWGHADGLAGKLGPTGLTRMRSWGVAPLSVDQGLALLDASATRDEAVLVPVRTDEGVLRSRPDTVPAVLLELTKPRRSDRPLPVGPSDEGRELRGRLRQLPAAEQELTVLELVCAEVAAALGHVSAAAVEPEREFSTAGLDSLTTLELNTRLNRATGVRLSATAAFDHSTPAALAGHLAGLIRSQPA